ncbi:thyroid receptor-interacting protein 11 [Asbolus verrucosus]|uniref:Thyroid receptor-interacting protein 11 n=1 Tax=Asbolus verrucosus TaxID=1661398 RepID=A0A482WDC0_ASBVE|nr:thyroid receptor-interacting protein 11 [Asbolus verrucosus]
MSQTDEGVEDLPADYRYRDYYGEEEEEEYEEEGSEDAWSIYDSETFISGPFQSEKSTIPEDILEFEFSFGYDCRKYFNLTVADPDTLVFASGNFINFFDVPTKTISFRRSALGGGIAHIKANPCPEFNHVAVAEHGEIPLIIIYEWPAMEINCILKGGSQRLYSHLDYSPDGLLLVSQGGEPDYLITVWNWPKRKILLRTKSYVNDVYRVKFSPHVPGQLTTAGVTHIKFWKMARTFTGLKLKGELGRFGKTEFSDILGILPMPDEKVVSGCAWGNILVWDAGLIKLEVFRTLRRKCHEGPIVQLAYIDGELWTVAMDGHVKVWWYEKIDQADPPDDDRVIQIEPTYDFHTPGLMLMCVRKRYPDPKDTTYFGQDGNGGIWIIDLNTKDTPQESVQIYKSHAGKVVDIAVCPWGPFLASLGEDGRLYLYSYLNRKLIFEYQFPARGACMIWLPPKIANSGDEILMGFDDGTLRLCILTIDTENETASLSVIQTTKPHEKVITKISMNRPCKVLVSGSDDATIFFFQVLSVGYVELVPIGYIKVPNAVTCLTWYFNKVSIVLLSQSGSQYRGYKVDELLVGCLRGEIIQVVVPHEPQDYTTVSYLLNLDIKENKFTTYKAQIRRDIKIREIQAKKAVKVAKKRVEMEKLKAENPGLDIDEEVFLADSETEEELEPLFIPEIPNRIIWMQSTEDDTIWLSMGGYDAGYIYEYKIDQKEEVPCRFKMVYDGDDIEISSYVYNYNKKYLIFAMQNGEIRVNKIHDGDFRDLSDYWSLAMHDNLNGFVPNMCFSYDERYFFTCGHDEDDEFIPELAIPSISARIVFPKSVHDEANYDKLSIEQASLKKEQDRIERLANKHKEMLRQKLKNLLERFQKVLKRNKKLLPSQVIPVEELELDPRVSEYIDMKLNEELALVKRKLAFDVQKSEVKMLKLRNHFVDNLAHIPIIVKGINSNHCVKMLRQRKIAQENTHMLSIIGEKLLEDEIKGRPPERVPPPPKIVIPKKQKDARLEYFLVNLSPSITELSPLNNKLTRLLHKYRHRKLKWERREEEWEEFVATKPAVGVNYPEDDIALEEAKATIGDYKLKSDKSYKPSKSQRESTVKKYQELLLSRVKQYNIRNDFNNKLFALREDKVRIRQELLVLQKKLEEIHEEISEQQVKDGPPVPQEDASEFPERDYEIKLVLEIEEDLEKQPEKEVIQKQTNFDYYERDILPKDTKKSDWKEMDVCVADFDVLCNMSKNEKKDTPWEYDIRTRRNQRKLFEQDEIIDEMKRKIYDFNNELEKIGNERFTVDVNAKLMDIFLMTLHEELIILKEFEVLEDDLQDKVNQKMSEVLDMQDIIQDSNLQIIYHNKEIEKMNEELGVIQKTFLASVVDNKFFDFLRKVFRKKYKPPRVQKDDESSSESSSSSSSSTESEDDAKSIDSRDFGIIKQDLNVCPKGCDPAVYDYTIESRSKRHQVEIKIKEKQKMIELLKKDLEIQNKKIVFIEKQLQVCQQDLEKYQREKQEKLNEVRCTVVLKLDQLQHLTTEDKTSKIMDTLLFSKARLSKLYKRTEELQVETEQQLNRHKRNVKHLTRMKTDCEYMASTVKKLQETILVNMQIKFGKVVDIIEIEEAMLKRTFGKDDLAELEEVLLKKIIHDLRLSMMDIKGMYIDQLHYWQEAIVKTQKELTMALRHSTSRQELLSLLTREKTELARAIVLQEKKKTHLQGIEDVARLYKDEIEKLEAILEEQNQQLQEIKDEIKLLKTKGMLLKPKEVKKEVEEEEEVKGWDLKDWDEEVEEEEEKRKPFSTEIIIPTTLHEKSQEVAASLLTEMLEALDVKLAQKSTETFIKSMLGSVMRGLSMTELVEELLKNLPIEPDDKQRGIIETTAEQLYVVQEPDATEEDIDYYSREIMEDIVDEVLLMKDEPQLVMARLVSKLVDNLPVNYLKQQTSLEFLVQKILRSQLNLKLDEKDFIHMLHTQEAENIMHEILQRVYDTGTNKHY